MNNLKFRIMSFIKEEVSENFKKISLEHDFKFLTRNEFKPNGNIYNFWEKSISSGDGGKVKIFVYPPSLEEIEYSWVVSMVDNKSLISEGSGENLPEAISNLKSNLVTTVDTAFNKH